MSFFAEGSSRERAKTTAHLAEFGIVAPVGRHGMEELLHIVADSNDKRFKPRTWIS
jgi:hypothetical protein